MLNSFAHFPQHQHGGGGRRPSHAADSPQTEESVRQCLAAAISTMDTIDDITQSKQMFHAFWITAYFAFTAAMVLYIYVIQNWDASPDMYGGYLAAATRCQSHMSSIAQKGSLLERYCLVLEELRVEALRQVKRLRPELGLGGGGGMEGGMAGAAGFQGMLMPVDTSPSDVTNYTELMGEAALNFNGMPVSAMGDFSGWGQFASMVSSGLGNLDGFMDDDTFRM